MQTYGRQYWQVQTVAIATLSDNTLAVMVVSATGVSVNILKKNVASLTFSHTGLTLIFANLSKQFGQVRHGVDTNVYNSNA